MNRDPETARNLLGIDEQTFFREAYFWYCGRSVPTDTTSRIAYYQKQADGIYPPACLAYAERIITLFHESEAQKAA